MYLYIYPVTFGPMFLLDNNIQHGCSTLSCVRIQQRRYCTWFYRPALVLATRCSCVVSVVSVVRIRVGGVHQSHGQVDDGRPLRVSHPQERAVGDLQR